MKRRKYRTNKIRTKLAREIGFNKGITVLEVGSGIGKDAVWAASLGAHLIAVEIHPKKCINIKERLKGAKLWDVAASIRADGQKLPFRERVFDAVYCRAVLHHLQNPMQAISEMCRVLKHGGKVAAIDEINALNPLWHISKFLVEHFYIRSYDNFLYSFEFKEKLHPFYPGELREYFRKANLQGIKVRHLWLPYRLFTLAVLFKLWLSLERIVERTKIPFVFGQLFIVGTKNSC